MTAKIYGLFDLNDPGRVRYVGRTKGALGARLKAHCRKAKSQDTHKARWIKRVWSEGGCISIRLLQEVPLVDHAEAERVWIKIIGRENLTNGTDGGDGTIGHRMSDAARARISAFQKGRVKPLEVREKISRSHIGLGHTPETKKKLSIASTGRRASEAARRKMSESQRGKKRPRTKFTKLSEETKKRMAAGQKKKLTTEQVMEIVGSSEKGVDLARRFGVTRTLISLIRLGKNRRYETGLSYEKIKLERTPAC